jgi:hypothetical protein
MWSEYKRMLARTLPEKWARAVESERFDTYILVFVCAEGALDILVWKAWPWLLSSVA